LLRPAIWSYAVQRLCTWYPLRRMLAGLVAATRPAYVWEGAAEAAKLEGELRTDGVAFLRGFVAPEIVGRITEHLQAASLKERFPPCRGNFTLDTVPDNVHVAEYETSHILRCPDVVAIANHPLLLGAAARYLGCKPTISNISIWWSLPADGTAQEAENYHRDVDEWRFVKFFLYLSDCDESAGPHCFIRGSHRSPRFLRIRRIDDSEVSKVFPAEDRLRITGAAGDAFLEDTIGLHKGQPPTGKRRLLLQVEYSISAIAVYQYRPNGAAPAGIEIDGYVNRLYFGAAQ
jgi:hypothetical protein